MSDSRRDSHEGVQAGWSSQDAERHLRSLELFGMRFGLDRMRRMMTALDSPERGFSSVHVLGTNGKSSTTRMIAAILQRHGLSTGAYLSPHLRSYTERVQVAERDISEHDFAVAISRAAWAAERVNRTLADDDHVTQFELLTAAAFSELQRREVGVAVVEAGLGGRYDATSVIDSTVTVLTNVGLEHTRWLGPTLGDIAAEKLAVLRAGSTLVVAEDLDPLVLELAERLAEERQAQILISSPEQNPVALAAHGAFQRRNFALARRAAEAYLRTQRIELNDDALREAAAHTLVEGRMQIVAEHPLTIFDGAHNPDAVRALRESICELIGDRRLALVLGVLEDKNAADMLATLLPLCERAWFTAPPSSRALSPAALQSLARQLGFEQSDCQRTPALALRDAQDFARQDKRDTVVLATGSIYLIGDLLEDLACPTSGGQVEYGQEDPDSQRNTTR